MFWFSSQRQAAAKWSDVFWTMRCEPPRDITICLLEPCSTIIQLVRSEFAWNRLRFWPCRLPRGKYSGRHATEGNKGTCIAWLQTLLGHGGKAGCNNDVGCVVVTVVGTVVGTDLDCPKWWPGPCNPFFLNVLTNSERNEHAGVLNDGSNWRFFLFSKKNKGILLHSPGNIVAGDRPRWSQTDSDHSQGILAYFIGGEIPTSDHNQRIYIGETVEVASSRTESKIAWCHIYFI